jgi:hypothetical protein
MMVFGCIGFEVCQELEEDVIVSGESIVEESK